MMLRIRDFRCKETIRPKMMCSDRIYYISWDIALSSAPIYLTNRPKPHCLNSHLTYQCKVIESINLHTKRFINYAVLYLIMVEPRGLNVFYTFYTICVCVWERESMCARMRLRVYEELPTWILRSYFSLGALDDFVGKTIERVWT